MKLSVEARGQMCWLELSQPQLHCQLNCLGLVEIWGNIYFDYLYWIMRLSSCSVYLQISVIFRF